MKREKKKNKQRKRAPRKTPKKEKPVKPEKIKRIKAKRKRKNWGRGSPRKKMLKALADWEKAELKIMLTAQGMGWSKKKVIEEKAKAKREIWTTRLKKEGWDAFMSRIANRASKHSEGQGSNFTFTTQQEADLVAFLVAREKLMIPVTRNEFKLICKHMNTKKRGWKPDKKWIKRFLDRHPSIKLKKSEALNRSRAQAKTEKACRQHFDTLEKAYELAESLSGGPLKAHQVGNCDEKGVVTRHAGKQKVFGVVKKASKAVIVGDLQMTMLETIWANATVGTRIYIGKGVRIPKDFDIKKWDEDAIFCMSPEGGMTREIWTNIVAPAIIASAPPCLPNEWRILSLDGYDPHVQEWMSLKAFWDARIIIFKERSQSSDMYQVLDYSIYGPLQGYIEDEEAYYISSFGGQNITQFQFPGLYKLAIDQALKVSSIKNGFRTTGLFPRMSADEWLSINGKKHSIKMEGETRGELIMPGEDFRTMRRQDPRTYLSGGMSKRQFDALNLSPRKPKKRSPFTILPKLPTLHKKKPKKPKTDARGVPLCLAEIANEPKRVQDLEEIEKERKKTHEKIKKENEAKQIAREQAKRKEIIRKEKKKKEIKKYAEITVVLKANNACKRDIPTLNQIRKFLRSKASLSKKDADAINEDNVLEKWKQYFVEQSI